jgi:hypothetical protein
VEVSWTRQPAEDGSPYEADVALAITPLMEPLLAIPDWFYKARDSHLRGVYGYRQGEQGNGYVTHALHPR